MPRSNFKEAFLSIPGQARSHRLAIFSHSLSSTTSITLGCPSTPRPIQPYSDAFSGESAQFLAQVIIPILDFVRNSICALCQPPLNSNHAGITHQNSTLSLSEGLIYNLLLSDLKFTKSGEQRKQNLTPFNTDRQEPHTRHIPNPQHPHAGSMTRT